MLSPRWTIPLERGSLLQNLFKPLDSPDPSTGEIELDVSRELLLHVGHDRLRNFLQLIHNVFKTL